MTLQPDRDRPHPAIRPRIAFARALIRAGRFIQSAAIMVMRPDDLVEFSRQMYARFNNVEGWSSDAIVGPGLTVQEVEALHRLPGTQGRALVLGVGGGREAIALARMGFAVTGLDFVPEMVEAAQRNAARQGVAIEGLVQELTQLSLSPGSYDVVWLSAAMYSCMPTRRRRVEFLRHIEEALRPGGHFFCEFAWREEQGIPESGGILRRALARLTLGYLDYESGDTLKADVEFIHNFSSEAEIQIEFAASGLELVHLQVWDGWSRGDALLRKREGPLPSGGLGNDLIGVGGSGGE